MTTFGEEAKRLSDITPQVYPGIRMLKGKRNA